MEILKHMSIDATVSMSLTRPSPVAAHEKTNGAGRILAEASESAGGAYSTMYHSPMQREGVSLHQGKDVLDECVHTRALRRTARCNAVGSD